MPTLVGQHPLQPGPGRLGQGLPHHRPPRRRAPQHPGTSRHQPDQPRHVHGGGVDLAGGPAGAVGGRGAVDAEGGEPQSGQLGVERRHLAAQVEEAEQGLGGPVVRLRDHQLQPLVHGAPLRVRGRPLGHLRRERDRPLGRPALEVEGDQQLEEAGRVRRHEVVAAGPPARHQVVGVREGRGTRAQVGRLRAPAAEADVGRGEVGVEQHHPALRRAPVDLHVGGLERPALLVEPDHGQVDPGREGGSPQRDGAAAAARAASFLRAGVHQLVEAGLVEREQQRLGQGRRLRSDHRTGGRRGGASGRGRGDRPGHGQRRREPGSGDHAEGSDGRGQGMGG